MSNLFDNQAPRAPGGGGKDRPRSPATAGLIKPTPDLPVAVIPYARGRIHRPAADPLGTGGLPATRYGLNHLLLDLCERLASAGGRDIPGKQLVAELGLLDTRSLRLLVAYGHVHHRIRQIVGTPGSGYCWGDCRPDVYEDMAAASRRMGICFLFNASLYSRKPVAIEMAQLTLDFAEQSGRVRSGRGEGTDELTAWLSTEGVTHSDLIEAMVELFAASETGREALRRVGRKHRGIFLDEGTLERLEGQAEGFLKTLQSARAAE